MNKEKTMEMKKKIILNQQKLKKKKKQQKKNVKVFSAHFMFSRSIKFYIFAHNML